MFAYSVVATYYYDNEEQTCEIQECVLGVALTKRRAEKRVKQWYEDNLAICKKYGSSEVYEFKTDYKGMKEASCALNGTVKAEVTIERVKLL